jgi:sialidase-1
MIRCLFFITTAVLVIPLLASATSPQAKVIDTKVISQQANLYHGWPTVVRRQNGELWLSWSGGRESHVCPFGQLCAMTSRDEGESWTFPRVLLDSATDDRDSGVLETAKGTLLATTFTSLAYEDSFTKATMMAEHTDKGWVSKTMPPERFARWKAAHERLNDEERRAELGEWIIRSTDGGKTWSPRIPTVLNSPHGPIQLKDGRLLYAGKQLWTKEKKIGVAESKDGGKTWTIPHPIGVWGLPSHLLRLRDGRLLMTYGHRRKPFGNQARLSSDNGQTWSEPMIISGDGIGGDLGYPSTVELGNGTLLTVWYEKMKDQPHAVLRQAIWKME